MGEAPTPQTIATIISNLKTTLEDDPTYFKSQPTGVHSIQESADEEDIMDVPEEAIGDDLSTEEAQAIHEAINRVFVKATSPEVAVKMTGKLFRSKRLQSKQAFDKDSKTKLCGRSNCPNRRSCYTMRRAKYLDKKHLYSQIACFGKSTAAHGTLTAGTIYRLQSSN